VAGTPALRGEATGAGRKIKYGFFFAIRTTRLIFASVIDKATIEKIKDAADIVDVVSEFVTLRRSGSSYKGLCPFHDEKTPSFYVTPSRGICHCFGCGKGGDSVSFIMQHEQMTYPEALRWLARKYHIEIKERELTDRERQEQSERESMFIINEWAASYFHDLLKNSQDGQAFGMQYFRQRGFRDDIIEKFRLGYDMSDRMAMADAAAHKGYNTDYLQKVGICYRTEHGQLMDRYAGRVIFPWTGISGKIVGFGGRVLDSRTKGVNQKYVNSPESDIFHKERELYGIYQAKRAIAREDRVYMVEGYTDVISMHQCGIENVVANSGTALSIHQIHTLHRFTSNITLLYDGDAAGIHAAMRGTDMLLAEGMSLKMLLLPDGDDPDSFARKHTADQFRDYVEEHQTDFIEFKTRLLLDGVTDPTKRTEAINSIMLSVSKVQDPILRATYLHDCARRLGISETTLINTTNRFIRESKSAQPTPRPQTTEPSQTAQPTPSATSAQASSLAGRVASRSIGDHIMRLVVSHGERIVFRGAEGEDGQLYDLTLAQYVGYNLAQDDLTLDTDLHTRMLNEAMEHGGEDGFKAEHYFIHHDDIAVSQEATRLIEERYRLSTERDDDTPTTEEQRLANEEESLLHNINHLLTDLRVKVLGDELKRLQQSILAATGDERTRLLQQYMETQRLRNSCARQVGSNIKM